MKTKSFIIFWFFLFALYAPTGFSVAGTPAGQASPGDGISEKVMVVIDSVEIDTTFLGVAVRGNRSVENQIENRLMQEGFEVMDAEGFSRRNEVTALLTKGDQPAANRLAGAFGVGILIHGDVRRSFVGNRRVMGRPTRFFSNELRIKAVSTRTGRVLFSGFETKPASGEGATLPLAAAASELCDQLITAIKGGKTGSGSKLRAYELSVSGVSFESVPELIRALRRIKGVEWASMQGFDAGRVLVGLKYDGNLMRLAEAITRVKRIPLEIVGAQSNAIKARRISRDR